MPELTVTAESASVRPIAPAGAVSDPIPERSGWRSSHGTARALSAVILALVLTALGLGVSAAYRALTDGFVSPTILSPDSDAVIESKLSLGRLLGERENLVARRDENLAAIEAAQSELRVLHGLEGASSTTLRWATEVASKQAARGAADLGTLRDERKVLQATLARLERQAADLERSLAAGLVHAGDVERARNAVDQVRVDLMKNEREHLSSETQLRMAALAREALTSRANHPLSTPEMVAMRQELAHVSVAIVKAEAELRSRTAQRRADEESLARVDELITQMRRRPIFRAIESSQTVAFVTYDEIRRVAPGARVYRCRIWGFFGCTEVGTVTEIVPGEVSLQDPWGTVGRGQYAMLQLSDPSAARARSLRVRGGGASHPADPAVAVR